MTTLIATHPRRNALASSRLARAGWEEQVSSRVNGWGLVAAERHRVTLIKDNDLVHFAPSDSDFDNPQPLAEDVLRSAHEAAVRWAAQNCVIPTSAPASATTR